MLAALTTLMCLPDHFDWSTWPFTVGYVVLYGTALATVAFMRPAPVAEMDRPMPEGGIRFQDLGPGMRRSRILTTGLVAILAVLTASPWLHEIDVIGAVCLGSVVVVAIILGQPGSVRLGAIATAAIFLLIVSSPLEYTNHVFLPEQGVIAHVTLGLGYVGLFAASLTPVRTRWMLLFVLVLGTALRVESLVQWPMDPLRRDMPVLMNHGIQSLLDGRFPYRIYFCSHDVPQTYLPVLWLTHLPFVAAGLDMRWGQVVATVVTALVISDFGRQSRGLRHVGLFCATLFFLMPETIWSVVHAETPSYWLWGSLFLWAAIHRRFMLAAVFLGITLGTRHFAYLMVPFAIIWYAWVVRSRREALLYLLVAASIASAILMPFAIEGPVPFMFGTFHWLTKFGETHRDWWYIYITFASWFYAFDIERWLAPIQLTTMILAVAGSVALGFWGRGRGDELHVVWRNWLLMAGAYFLFLMFNSIIWRYLHVMPIVIASFLVALRLQNRPGAARQGSERVVHLVGRPVAYGLVVGILGAIFVSSLVYMGWAYARSRDSSSVQEHAARIAPDLRPGDLVVDRGLFNAWPVMQGASFKVAQLPKNLRYVIRLRSQFPPAFERVVYFDGADLFDPERDAPDLLTYMRYEGHDDGKRSRAHFFVNPHPSRVTWRLSHDPDRIFRSELTAKTAGVALGTRRRNARFFFGEAAPPGYFSGWNIIRSMFHQWTCVLARPPGQGREIRVEFSVPDGERGWLVTGIDDYALWASRPAVTIRLDGPGFSADGRSFVHPNEQGIFVWGLGKIAAGNYTATVTAPSYRQRVFCFDLALSEPASPGQWGQNAGLGM
jgi:hypothetical protein